MTLKFARTCFKKSFRTRQLAKNRMKELNKTAHSDKKLNAVYYCEECQGYHFTSMEKERSREYTRKLNDRKP